MLSGSLLSRQLCGRIDYFIIITVVQFVVITNGAGGLPKWQPVYPGCYAREADEH